MPEVKETKTDSTVEKKEAVVVVPEDDTEQKLAAKDAEIAKLRDEKENYRKMGLKYKQASKEPEKDVDTESYEAIARRIAEETILNSREAQLDREKDDLIKATIRQNRELKLALANKAPIATSSPNQDMKVEVTKESYYSDDQLRELQRRAGILKNAGVKIDEKTFIESVKKEHTKGR